MNRRQLLTHMAAALPAFALSSYAHIARAATTGGSEPMDAGPFSPDWNSLSAYQTPEWFRNAKFGLWAHWGPQCEPEFGDWYARNMYDEGGDAYRYHRERYGHPSEFGFKDVIHQWKADQWDPEGLLTLYKEAGAKYFVAMASHHDNLDLYDSKYHAWNSTRIGPRKDLIGGWARAARNNGLRFGVSVHSSHAWTWYEMAQRADKTGPYAGVPYDGRLTKADGEGTWWEGLDPQDLYAQNHPLSQERDGTDQSFIDQWNWLGGAATPSHEYSEKFYNRTVDLINKYDPDLLYFDDNALPFWPIRDVGLRIAAHMYNRSIATKGKLEAVINGKMLDAVQRRCMVWDIERGQSNTIEPLPWQTDTCIGGWHYARRIYDGRRYKSAMTVVHMLIDIVSKNGNLLLSVPVRGNGTIDEQERAIVEEIGRWMAANGEGIYDTRPWSVYGEGSVMESAAPIVAQGMNEGKNRPFSPSDVRFTAKGDAVYAFVMGWPADGKVLIKSMRTGSPHLNKDVSRVEYVGGPNSLAFEQTAEGLHAMLPPEPPALPYAFALRIV